MRRWWRCRRAVAFAVAAAALATLLVAALAPGVLALLTQAVNKVHGYPAWVRRAAETPEPPAFSAIRKRVTDLGLAFSLVTRWTAFVAVSEQVYNADAANTRTRPVPLPMVAGTRSSAYPNRQPFTGAAGPEPETWMGLALIVTLSAALARRRRRVTGSAESQSAQ